MGFFRRKNDPDKLLHGLRDIARDITEQIFQHSLVNPTRAREQIDEAARLIFEDIARSTFSQSKDKDGATTALIYNEMFCVFSQRYDEPEAVVERDNQKYDYGSELRHEMRPTNNGGKDEMTRKLTLCFVILGLLTIVVGRARAQSAPVTPFPTWAHYCVAIGRLDYQCEADEQRVKNRLFKIWPNIRDELKAQCVPAENAHGNGEYGSYQRLMQCLVDTASDRLIQK